MKRWKIAIPAIVIPLALVAWYAFRPERLVLNQAAHEAFPRGVAP